MKKLLALFALLPCLASAQVNITNITHAAVVSPSDFVLGITNSTTRLLPVSGIAGLAQQGSQALTNWSSISTNVALGLPTIVVFTNGTYLKDGVLYTATNTTTSAIQEAIDALPLGTVDGSGYVVGPGGGVIQLHSGIYWTSNAIVTPYLTNAAGEFVPFTLTIQGCGMPCSGIVYNGPGPADVLRIGRPNTDLAINTLNLRDMFVMSATNACTNILYINSLSSGTQVDRGGVARADIERCWFGYWGYVRLKPTFSPSHEGATGQTALNLIGINAQCMYDDIISIKNCAFSFCGVGIKFMVDHGYIENNMFEQCGNWGSNPYLTNSWPIDTPEVMGPGILLCDPPAALSGGGHNMWNIRDNNFVATMVHYASVLNGFDTTDWPGNRRAIVIYHDTGEDRTNAVSIATTGHPVTFINCRGYEGVGPALGTWGNDTYRLKARWITNTADYRTFTNLALIPPTNMVTHVSHTWATNTGPFGFGGHVIVSNLFLSAPVWRDQIISGMALGAGASAPSIEVVGPTHDGLAIRGLGFAHGEDAHAAAQLNHDIAPTNSALPAFFIEPHLHLSCNDLSTGTNATFRIVYEWSNINGVYTNISGAMTNSISFTNLYQHSMLEFGHITNNAAAGAVSTIFRFGIERLNGGAGDMGNTACVIVDSVDIHYPVWRLGSRTESGD